MIVPKHTAPNWQQVLVTGGLFHLRDSFSSFQLPITIPPAILVLHIKLLYLTYLQWDKRDENELP